MVLPGAKSEISLHIDLFLQIFIVETIFMESVTGEENVSRLSLNLCLCLCLCLSHAV